MSSQVHVRQPHKMTQDAAKARLADFEAMLGKYKVGLTWKGYTAQISGLGVSGSVEIQPAEVTVTVHLGFLARAAGVDATKLQASIGKRLKEAYA
jgi:putative polyhydroxyalkanoate system protein